MIPPFQEDTGKERRTSSFLFPIDLQEVQEIFLPEKSSFSNLYVQGKTMISTYDGNIWINHGFQESNGWMVV
jgi:hypothetical protein